MHASPFFTALERSISFTRLEAYRDGGTKKDGLCRYFWNMAICESLYPSFQVLEVAYRNAVHLELGKLYAAAGASEQWLSASGFGLQPAEKEVVSAAADAVKTRGKLVTEGLLVAELNFGFWTSLLDTRYDRIWPKIIKGVFPKMPNSDRTRAKASVRLNLIRRFRNAALHHHSIWHWSDIVQQHSNLHEAIGWICPSAEKIIKSVDRFPTIHSAGHSAFLTNIESISN